MFTEETLEEVWKQVRNYSNDHMGIKYGDDFPVVATILSKNKYFITMGGLMQVLSLMHLAGREKEAQTNPEGLADEVLTKPSFLHEHFAQMFYLGYKLGKADAEKEILERMTKDVDRM